MDFENGESDIISNFAQHPLAYKHTKYEGEREIRTIVFQKGFKEEEFDQLRDQDLVEDKEEYLDFRRSASADEPSDNIEYHSNPITVSVDIERLISEIRISPFGSGWQHKSLDCVVSNKFELDIPVEQSMLDLETEPDKPSVDIDPSKLYSDIENEGLVETLNR